MGPAYRDVGGRPLQMVGHPSHMSDNGASDDKLGVGRHCCSSSSTTRASCRAGSLTLISGTRSS